MLKSARRHAKAEAVLLQGLERVATSDDKGRMVHPARIGDSTL